MLLSSDLNSTENVQISVRAVSAGQQRTYGVGMGSTFRSVPLINQYVPQIISDGSFRQGEHNLTALRGSRWNKGFAMSRPL